MRDRTRMEEMGKAKNKAEGEKNVFKHMLEQAHERWLRERQELFRDALSKVAADDAPHPNPTAASAPSPQPCAPSSQPRAPSPLSRAPSPQPRAPSPLSRAPQVEANASRVREQQTRILQLDKQLRNQAQLEEEIKMYKEQARCLAEPPPQPQP